VCGQVRTHSRRKIVVEPTTSSIEPTVLAVRLCSCAYLLMTIARLLPFERSLPRKITVRAWGACPSSPVSVSRSPSWRVAGMQVRVPRAEREGAGVSVGMAERGVGAVVSPKALAVLRQPPGPRQSATASCWEAGQPHRKDQACAEGGASHETQPRLALRDQNERPSRVAITGPLYRSERVRSCMWSRLRRSRTMSTPSDVRTTVITGASTGIGRATALHLARRGWQVFAGVRNERDAEALRSEGMPSLRPLILDAVRLRIFGMPRTFGAAVGASQADALLHRGSP